MKFKRELRSDKKARMHKYKSNWHVWFAWCPVRSMSDKTTVMFFEKVLRKGTWVEMEHQDSAMPHFEYEYEEYNEFNLIKLMGECDT